MSVRFSEVNAGLNVPPHGTPSTTRRNASNSFRPQKSGTALAGPASPPGATSTPTASESALRRSLIPRALNSSPVNTYGSWDRVRIFGLPCRGYLYGFLDDWQFWLGFFGRRVLCPGKRD